jgi:hypothetical protein
MKYQELLFNAIYSYLSDLCAHIEDNTDADEYEKQKQKLSVIRNLLIELEDSL